jgi:hypothetical protein
MPRSSFRQQSAIFSRRGVLISGFVTRKWGRFGGCMMGQVGCMDDPCIAIVIFELSRALVSDVMPRDIEGRRHRFGIFLKLPGQPV